MKMLKRLLFRLRADHTTEELVSLGMKVGKNFKRLTGVILDPAHCWLIEIGDDVYTGIGTVITKSQPSGKVVVGVPGKVLRDRKPGEH